MTKSGKPTGMPNGRPTLFSHDLADEICARLSKGEPLLKICMDDHMPDRRTVIYWTKSNPVFNEQYVEARDQGVDALTEEATIISDDKTGEPARDNLRITQRRWYASKIASRRYGDKTHTEISGVDGKPIETKDNALADQIAAIIELARTRKEVLGDAE